LKEELEKITGKWTKSDQEEYFININGSTTWTEIHEGGEVFDNFEFVKFEGEDEDVILRSQSKSFYVKLTATKAFISDMEKADKYSVILNGSWNIKPERKKSTNEGFKIII
jgi:hypothetical protein